MYETAIHSEIHLLTRCESPQDERAKLNRPKSSNIPRGGTLPPRFALESGLTAYSRSSRIRVTTMAVMRSAVVTAHIAVFALIQPAKMDPIILRVVA